MPVAATPFTRLAVLAPVKVNWPRALGSLARLICWPAVVGAEGHVVDAVDPDEALAHAAGLVARSANWLRR